MRRREDLRRTPFYTRLGGRKLLFGHRISSDKDVCFFGAKNTHNKQKEENANPALFSRS
jgi:hypothetical protein